MSDFLQAMREASLARAAALAPAAGAIPERPVVPWPAGGFAVIAEIKQRSPAEGALSDGGDLGRRARRYAEAGAAAISVLTEPTRFDGALAHLEQVAAAVGETVPVMRKDFLVHPSQVREARAAGASGVLLIATMLGERELADLLAAAREHSLWVLLECFDRRDLDRVRALLEQPAHAERAARGELLIGVNSRDLRTLAVVPERLAELAPLLPAAAVAVAESGIGDARAAARAAQLGYDAVLVGTALMREPDPARLLEELARAGRAGRAA